MSWIAQQDDSSHREQPLRFTACAVHHLSHVSRPSKPPRWTNSMMPALQSMMMMSGTAPTAKQTGRRHTTRCPPTRSPSRQ